MNYRCVDRGYGLTGRKAIMDTYGSASCHGVGVVSGEAPLEADGSAVHPMRHVAKHMVRSDPADHVELLVVHAICCACIGGFYEEVSRAAIVTPIQSRKP
ncbi:methionine adenosyltransferase domain-containing protein [Microbacterium lacticum]